MAFRRPQHFVLMLLVMAAFLALGTAALAGFVQTRHAGDLRNAGVPSPTGCVVRGLTGNCHHRRRFGGLAHASLSRTIAIADGNGKSHCLRAWFWWCFSGGDHPHPRQRCMMRRASRVFPVKACDFIRANQLPVLVQHVLLGWLPDLVSAGISSFDRWPCESVRR